MEPGQIYKIAFDVVSLSRYSIAAIASDERSKVWGKSVGTTIQVGVSKIRHGDNGGKATLLGSIITEAKKN